LTVVGLQDVCLWTVVPILELVLQYFDTVIFLITGAYIYMTLCSWRVY